jgi:hypothetical protein
VATEPIKRKKIKVVKNYMRCFHLLKLDFELKIIKEALKKNYRLIIRVGTGEAGAEVASCCDPDSGSRKRVLPLEAPALRR